MSERVLGRGKRKTDADYEAAMRHLLAEMDFIEQEMDRVHAAGEQLKVETQVIKARIGATILRLREAVERLARSA